MITDEYSVPEIISSSLWFKMWKSLFIFVNGNDIITNIENQQGVGWVAVV